MAAKSQIQVDSDTLRALLESAKADLTRLKAEHFDLTARIRSLEDQIPMLEGKLESAARARKPGERGSRRKKGENARRIFELFGNLPEGKGLSITEIAGRAGIGHSSARVVLETAREMYEKGPDGLYRRTKLITASSLSKNSNG